MKKYIRPFVYAILCVLGVMLSYQLGINTHYLIGIVFSELFRLFWAYAVLVRVLPRISQNTTNDEYQTTAGCLPLAKPFTGNTITGLERE